MENCKKYIINMRRDGPRLTENAGSNAPALGQEYLEETDGVECSFPSWRRLLTEVRVGYQKTTPFSR